MKRVFVLLAMATLAACDRSAPPSTLAAPPSTAVSDTTAADDPVPAQPPFVNRTWVRPGELSPPGSMMIFLSDGTLLSDSCFETYRLSRWQSGGDGRLTWQEDGVDIDAKVLRADEGEFVLELQLSSGSEQHRFVPATIPYVCPDMPR